MENKEKQLLWDSDITEPLKAYEMFKGSHGYYQQFRRCVGAARPEFQTYAPRERTSWFKRFTVETWIRYERERIFIIHRQPTQHSCQELLRAKSSAALPVWSLHLLHQQSSSEISRDQRVSEKPFWRPERRQCFLNKQYCYQCCPWTSTISITKEIVRNAEFQVSPKTC